MDNKQYYSLMNDNNVYTIEIYGLLSDVKFHMARICAEDLFDKHPTKFKEPISKGYLEFQWHIYIEKQKQALAGEMFNFQDTALIYANDLIRGGPKRFIQWAEVSFHYENYRPPDLYATIAEQAYKEFLNNKNHIYVFFDITIGSKKEGRIVMELYQNTCPRTVENFRCLCTGEKGVSDLTDFPLSYKGAQIHRLVPGGWIQGGDIGMKRGDGGESIYGTDFEDENFSVKHNKRGVIGMANRGRHTNSSQFYITLQAAAWMDTKYVAFGQVVEGTKTLKAIEKQQTINDRPRKEVLISNCGQLKFEF